MRIYSYQKAKPAAEWTCGIDVVISEMYEHLRECGVEYVDDPEKADLRVAHAMSPNKEPVDVLHCHGLYPTGSEDLEGWTWEANQRVIEAARNAYVVTVPSPWVAEMFARDMGFLPRIVPHGIHIEQWPELQRMGEFSGRSPVVLWNKNRAGDVCSPADVMALASVAGDYKFFTTFGQRLANVTVLGVMPHEEMVAKLYEADIYLATTKETFGIGILEAQAAALPVLAYNYGSAPYLIQHRDNGYLVEPGDIDGLREGLDFIVANYPRMSVASRASAQRFPWSAAMPQYVAAYEEALRIKRDEAQGRVTVVVPCYNYAQYVEQTIASIKNQTYTNFDCVVVNDGSTDDSKKVIEEAIAGDGRFSLIDKPNSGVADTRNTGIIAKDNPFVLCIDADDALLPHALNSLVSPLKAKRDLGISYGKLEIMDATGFTEGLRAPWPDKCSVEQQLAHKNQVPSCCMLRREAVLRAGGFRQRTAPAEDAELWTRIMALGYGAELATTRTVYRYRLHSGSASTKVRDQSFVEPNWTGWIPASNGGHASFAQQTPSARASHPVIYYDKPIVSFVIPVGNAHISLLLDALDSIAGQDNPLWEIIVVDDTTAGDLRKQSVIPYQRAFPYVRWFRNEHHGNVSEARNLGAKRARGHYLCFLDADDMLLPGFITKTLRVITECHTDSILVYTDWKNYPGGEYHQAANWSLNGLLQQALFAVTFVHPKAAWEAVGGFDPEIPLWEDWDYSIKLALAGYKGVRCPQALFVYRYDTGKRREGALLQQDNLIKYIREKYAGATPTKPKGGG